MKLEEFLAIIFTNISASIPPFLLWVMIGIVWHTWWCPTSPWSSLVFLHAFLFLFLRLDNINWTIVKFADFSFCCQNLLLSPFRKFFISVILFTPEFLYSGLYNFYLFFWYSLFGERDIVFILIFSSSKMWFTLVLSIYL